MLVLAARILHLVASGDSWTIAAAVASALVAAFTGLLAWQTGKLAKRTEADVAAQWRPLLVPERAGVLAFDAATRTFYFEVYYLNNGRGPGLNGEISLVYEGRTDGPYDLPNIVAVDREQTEVVFRCLDLPDGRDQVLTVLLACEDVGGQKHHTTILFRVSRRAKATAREQAKAGTGTTVEPSTTVIHRGRDRGMAHRVLGFVSAIGTQKRAKPAKPD